MIINNDLIGVLPGERSRWKEKGKQVVFVNGNNQIQYTIEALVEEDKVLQAPFFTGYINCLKDYGIEECYHEDIDVRIEDFSEIIQNYLFVFNPISVAGYPRIDNVTLVIKPNFYKEGMTFVSVRYYTTDQEVEQFIEEFKQRGSIRKPIGLCETREFPYVLCEETKTGKVYGIGTSEVMLERQDHIRWKTKLNVYLLDDFEKGHMIVEPRNSDENLAFVESENDAYIKDCLETINFFEEEKEQSSISIEIQKYLQQGGATEKEFLANWERLIAKKQFA